MKPGLGWTRDPALHLIALSTAILGTALALNSHSAPWHRSRPIKHRPGCRACSFCRPEVAAARDSYLIRTGSIEPPEGSE